MREAGSSGGRGVSVQWGHQVGSRSRVATRSWRNAPCCEACHAARTHGTKLAVTSKRVASSQRDDVTSSEEAVSE